MTEQTAVTGFFPVVKSNKNNFGSHAAKRRKVEVEPAEVTMKRRAKRSTHNTRKAKLSTELSLSKLLFAEPIKVTSETTSSTDGHKNPKRKASNSLKDNKSQIDYPPVNNLTDVGVGNHVETELQSNIKVDPWISEQAKLVLAMGRGSKAVQASQERSEKTALKSAKASDVFKPSSQVTENKGNVRDVCLQKFKESITETKNISGRGSLRQKYSHLISSSRGNVRSEQVTSPRVTTDEASATNECAKVPAYQRHKHLTVKKPEPAFVLPQKYKSLLEAFRSADSVLFLLHRRSETCTFERLKTSVQSMLGKKFTEKHLGQMKTVYSEGFTFRIEKKLRDLQGMPSKPQLTIEANFEGVSASKVINQTVLIARRNIFESALVEITKKHHQTFLKKLNLKINENDLQRWHPHFKLADVPDIEEAVLPKVFLAKPITSAKDVLDSNQCIPQVAKALEKVAKQSLSETGEKSSAQPSEAPKVSKSVVAKQDSNNEAQGVLKGVSSDLLERIRKKEMRKAELAMLRDPVQERRLSMLNQLPDVVRTLKTYFTTEKKAAIPLEDCSVKFSESIGQGNSSTNIEDQIKLLHELVPDWLSIVTVRKCPYVKIAKSADVNEVLQRLNVIKEKETKK